MDRWSKYVRLLLYFIITVFLVVLCIALGNVSEDMQGVCCVFTVVFSIAAFVIGVMLFEHVARLVFDAVDYLDQIRRMLVEIKNKDIKQI